MIEKILHEDSLLALIIRREFYAEGIQFFTPGVLSQQVGYMNRPRGYVIPPHVHRPVPREVQFTQEVLFIKSGLIRVDFYKPSGDYLESRILRTGDTILLAFGGHGFEVIEPCEMIEVKQGPYAGEGDKAQLQPVAADAIILPE